MARRCIAKSGRCRNVSLSALQTKCADGNATSAWRSHQANARMGPRSLPSEAATVSAHSTPASAASSARLLLLSPLQRSTKRVARAFVESRSHESRAAARRMRPRGVVALITPRAAITGGLAIERNTEPHLRAR
eukprot:5033607-Prymnesium_polylepis.1